MMSLYHLHNPDVPKFLVTCSNCNMDINIGYCYNSEKDPEFHLCQVGSLHHTWAYRISLRIAIRRLIRSMQIKPHFEGQLLEATLKLSSPRNNGEIGNDRFNCTCSYCNMPQVAETSNVLRPIAIR